MLSILFFPFRTVSTVMCANNTGYIPQSLSLGNLYDFFSTSHIFTAVCAADSRWEPIAGIGGTAGGNSGFEYVLFTMSTVQRRIFSRAFFCLTSQCVHSLCRASFGAAFTERSPRGSSSSMALLSEYAPVLRHLHNKLLRDAELHYTWALWFSIIERQLSLMPYANFYESDAQVGSCYHFLWTFPQGTLFGCPEQFSKLVPGIERELKKYGYAHMHSYFIKYE